MTTSWTTSGLSPADQISFWGDVLCQAFTPLSPWRTRQHIDSSTTPTGMLGWVRSSRVGASNAAEISSCSQVITHGRREVARSDEDVVFVNLQLDGTCAAQQDDRRCVVGPGEFALFDSTRPYVLEFLEDTAARRPWRVLSFRVPRDQIADLMTPGVGTTSARFTGRDGAGGILAATMLASWGCAHELDDAAAHSVSDAHVAMLRGVLAGVRTGDSSGATAADDHRRAAVIRYVSGNIGRGRVSADDAARAAGVSVRTLHNLFERTGTTFGTVVRRARLDACRRELEAAGSTRTVAAIAATWGFSDAAHLARTFRSEYGCSPTEHRNRHRVDEGHREIA